jgi:hypothetical protein
LIVLRFFAGVRFAVFTKKRIERDPLRWAVCLASVAALALFRQDGPAAAIPAHRRRSRKQAGMDSIGFFLGGFVSPDRTGGFGATRMNTVHRGAGCG